MSEPQLDFTKGPTTLHTDTALKQRMMTGTEEALAKKALQAEQQDIPREKFEGETLFRLLGRKDWQGATAEDMSPFVTSDASVITEVYDFEKALQTMDKDEALKKIKPRALTRQQISQIYGKETADKLPAPKVKSITVGKEAKPSKKTPPLPRLNVPATEAKEAYSATKTAQQDSPDVREGVKPMFPYAAGMLQDVAAPMQTQEHEVGVEPGLPKFWERMVHTDDEVDPAKLDAMLKTGAQFAYDDIKKIAKEHGRPKVTPQDFQNAQNLLTGDELPQTQKSGDFELWHAIAGAVAAIAPALIGYSAYGKKGMWAGLKATGEGMVKGAEAYDDYLETLRRNMQKSTGGNAVVKQDDYGEFNVIAYDKATGKVIDTHRTGIIGPERIVTDYDLDGKPIKKAIPWQKRPVKGKLKEKAGSDDVNSEHGVQIGNALKSQTPEKTIEQWAVEAGLEPSSFPPQVREQPLWKAIAGHKLWEGDSPESIRVRARRILNAMNKPKTSEVVKSTEWDAKHKDGWTWRYRRVTYKDGTEQIQPVMPVKPPQEVWSAKDMMDYTTKAMGEESKRDPSLIATRMMLTKVPYFEQTFMYKEGNSTRNVNRLYAFMKLAQLDNTAVREGELYLNMHFQSLPDKLQRLHQAVKGGSHYLSESQMQSMDRDIATMFQAQMILASRRVGDYIKRVNRIQGLTKYQKEQLVEATLGTGFKDHVYSQLKRSFGKTHITNAKTKAGVMEFAKSQKMYSTFAWRKPDGKIVTYVRYPSKMGDKKVINRKLYTFEDID